MQLRTDARANRERITEAATELFAERGLAVEMKDLAERAGVAVGTLYRHFDSKEDLLRAIVFEAIDEIIARAREAEAEADELTALRRLMEVMYRAIQRYGWLVEAMMAGELPPGLRAEVQARREDEELDDIGERVVQRCIDQGTMRADLDVTIASAMIFGTIAPWNRERIGLDRPAEEMAEAVITTFLRGGGVDAAGTPPQPPLRKARPRARRAAVSPRRRAGPPGPRR